MKWVGTVPEANISKAEEGFDPVCSSTVSKQQEVELPTAADGALVNVEK